MFLPWTHSEDMMLFLQICLPEVNTLSLNDICLTCLVIHTLLFLGATSRPLLLEMLVIKCSMASPRGECQTERWDIMGFGTWHFWATFLIRIELYWTWNTLIKFLWKITAFREEWKNNVMRICVNEHVFIQTGCDTGSF